MPRAPVPLRTKIVATLGPASDSVSKVVALARAGMAVARLNLAHGDPAYHARLVRVVRAASRRAGRPIAVMVDLAGPKVRIGELLAGQVVLRAGRPVQLTTRPVQGTAELLSVTEPRLVRDVRRGDPIFLADGTLELEVRRVADATIDCRVVTGGSLTPHKGINVPRTRLRIPSLTRKDRRDLRHALRLGVDLVALSFVRKASDLERVRRITRGAGVPLIAKIEKEEAVRNLEEIVEAADGVMVARGDLGVEVRLEDVPLLQKRIIRLANESAKPVITATQMLKSMVDAPHPTRAEAADVANAILDGTDAVMLSEETAMGRFPLASVETMVRIARRAEASLDAGAFRQRAGPVSFAAGAVSEAAVRVAEDVSARAIVTPTFAGATPRFVSRLRPPVPIIALCQNRAAAQALCLSWGVEPVFVPKLGQFEAAVRTAKRLLRERAWIHPGDRFVITAGFPPGNASNLMTVQELDA